MYKLHTCSVEKAPPSKKLVGTMAPEESAIATILTLLAAREMICLCRGEATTYKKHQLATS
jgi:hypothetical protein